MTQETRPEQTPDTDTTPPAPNLQALSQNVARARRVRLIGSLCLLFLLLGGLWAGYWYLFMRTSESTDDAYVAGNQVRISSRITGNVREIYVDNTQAVRAGQVLLRLDDTDAKLALDRARSDLAGTVRQVSGMMAEEARLTAVIELRKKELGRVEGDLDRRKNRKTSYAVSAEELSHARDAVAEAEVALRIAELAWQSSKVLLRDTPVHDQPLVQQRAHQMREAWLAVQRCAIKSPVDGFVARRSVQVGTHVTPGDPLMAVVPLAEVWVDANFKEVQLTRMRIGQRATVEADLYGSSATYTGTVVGFTAGTGSSFSLLPPENATGNWIKVVQRVPVKIVLQQDELHKWPLLVGLSCTVHVDVSDTQGTMLTPDAPSARAPARPLFRTTALEHDPAEINREIETIIAANSMP